MPHVSGRKLKKEIEDKLENHLISLIRDSGSANRVRIFKELLTKTERLMIAKRIGALFLLKKGIFFYKVSDVLQISSSTAARFERDLDLNKYRHTGEWVWRKTRAGRYATFMESLIKLAFTGRTKSFKQSVEEM